MKNIREIKYLWVRKAIIILLFLLSPIVILFMGLTELLKSIPGVYAAIWDSWKNVDRRAE